MHIFQRVTEALHGLLKDVHAEAEQLLIRTTSTISSKRKRDATYWNSSCCCWRILGKTSQSLCWVWPGVLQWECWSVDVRLQHRQPATHLERLDEQHWRVRDTHTHTCTVSDAVEPCRVQQALGCLMDREAEQQWVVDRNVPLRERGGGTERLH